MIPVCERKGRICKESDSEKKSTSRTTILNIRENKNLETFIFLATS